MPHSLDARPMRPVQELAAAIGGHRISFEFMQRVVGLVFAEFEAPGQGPDRDGMVGGEQQRLDLRLQFPWLVHQLSIYRPVCRPRPADPSRPRARSGKLWQLTRDRSVS